MGNNNRRKNLFAVLEISVVLVVGISIVAIIAVSFFASQKKERDARRKSDLKVISQALDQYFDTCGYVFPSQIPNNGTLACPPPNAKTYLIDMPGDPQTGKPYRYTPGKMNTSYSICTNDMETLSVNTYCITNK